MSPLDSAFLRLEQDTAPMHVGSVAILEGPPPSYGDVVRKVASKLHLVPRYRQRVRTVPFGLGRPVWVDDPHFQILYHIRHTAVPSPGGAREVRNLAGRVLAQHLDHRKPLWELWVVEGLRNNEWAVISKVHHCMVDGVAGSELMTLIFDSSSALATEPAQPWRPGRTPSGLGLAAAAVADAVQAPARALPALGTLAGALRTPRTSARRLSMMVGRPRPSVTTLNGALGPHRRWRWTERSFDEVRELKSALGGTMNDVMMAATTRGFRELLLERGDALDPGCTVRALIPVSVRTADEHGANRVTGVLADLPVGTADPMARFLDLRAQMQRLKASHQANAGDVALKLAEAVPAPLLDLGMRATFRLPQPFIQTVVTNVPGPRAPLYLLGRRLETVYPYVPLGWEVRVNVAIMTYVRQIGFGVNADLDAVPDADRIIAGIDAGFGELHDLAAPARQAAQVREHGGLTVLEGGARDVDRAGTTERSGTTGRAGSTEGSATAPRRGARRSARTPAGAPPAATRSPSRRRAPGTPTPAETAADAAQEPPPEGHRTAPRTRRRPGEGPTP